MSTTKLSLTALVIFTLLASSCGHSGEPPTPTRKNVPRLIRMLKNDEPEIRLLAVETLAKVGPDAVAAVPTLLNASWDLYWDIREGARSAIRSVGDDALPAIMESLDSENPETKSAAANMLGYYPDAAREQFPKLFLMLKDENPKIRWAAAKAIAGLGPDGRDAVPGLIDLVNERNVNLRTAAANALGRIGPDAKEAVPYLVEMVKDRNAVITTAGISSLRAIGTDIEEAIPVLIGLLKDNRGFTFMTEYNDFGEHWVNYRVDKCDYGSFCEHVPSFLVEIGKPAVPALIRELGITGNKNHLSAKSILKRIAQNGELTEDEVISLLSSKDENDQFAAMLFLKEMEPIEETIPYLVNTISGEEHYYDNLALVLLLRFAPEHTHLIPILLQEMGSGNGPINEQITKALIEIGPTTAPLLLDALKTKNSYIRATACEALLGIDATPPEAIPLLIEILDDENSLTLKWCKAVLAQMGPDAVDALPKLREMLENAEKETERNSLLSVIEQIESTGDAEDDPGDEPASMTYTPES